MAKAVADLEMAVTDLETAVMAKVAIWSVVDVAPVNGYEVRAYVGCGHVGYVHVVRGYADDVYAGGASEESGCAGSASGESGHGGDGHGWVAFGDARPWYVRQGVR